MRQIKARSEDAITGDAALFAAITHDALRKDYWFIFYSERMDTMWLMSSEEFLREAVQNKSGSTVGLRSIWFNGKRRDPFTGQVQEYTRPRFEKYIANDSRRIRDGMAWAAQDRGPADRTRDEVGPATDPGAISGRPQG